MTASKTPIAFVDDDEDLLAANGQTLTLAGYAPQLFSSAEAALASLSSSFEGVVVSDLRMPGTNGLTLFRELKKRDPDMPVILVTGHGDIETAVSSLNEGVYDFIAKPYSGDRLLASVGRAAEKRRLVMENRRLHAMSEAEQGSQLLGETPAIVRLRQTIRQIADAEVDVLIEGETGSGKEVVANLIHALSPRRNREYVVLNCGALPEAVMESELFGHERGAFTGADRRRIGRIEHANGGTLFLDELESMPPALQVKLLRVLEAREIAPLGVNETRAVDLRVVAAVKIDLSNPALRGDFREDLYYRLNVVTLRVPPLRERKDDIPLLFGHFLFRAAQRFRRDVPELTPALRSRLMRHDWPGNVRELAHFAERVVLGVEPQDAAPEPRQTNPSGLAEKLAQFEAELLRDALERHKGDIPSVLEELKLPRKTFYDKLQRHGLTPKDFR